ncbi:MAG: hypothetical protein CVU56_29715 [Deltaproteobacteria bacterium HGW-Deltaproteobacteria-14]|jgi:hypothetical protein|nr:MAG: hypothetical protein CVU56_29715 [Deltaproteobacteria bacterium HGW-Deltaproteobacteria-14]
MILARSASPLRALATAALLLTGACGDDGATTPADTSTAADADVTDDTAAVEDTTPADTTPADTTPACNPILQTGCEDGQNCTFSGDATVPACAAGGTVAYGEECSGANGCALGVCMSLNDTGYRCYKFCQTIAHCDGDAQCLSLTGTVYKVCEIGDIYTHCDLLLQDCDGGKGCYPIANQAQPVCLPAGAEAAGDPCTDAAACAKGNICINQRCKRVCDPNASDPCGNFTPCSSYGTAGYCDE